MIVVLKEIDMGITMDCFLGYFWGLSKRTRIIDGTCDCLYDVFAVDLKPKVGKDHFLSSVDV